MRRTLHQAHESYEDNEDDDYEDDQRTVAESFSIPARCSASTFSNDLNSADNLEIIIIIIKTKKKRGSDGGIYRSSSSFLSAMVDCKARCCFSRLLASLSIKILKPIAW